MRQKPTMTEQEKNEMRADGLSLSRREEFRRMKAGAEKVRGSLDGFIAFLGQLRAIFFPFPVSRRRTADRMMRL
ncbi:MAG: hypothetical protein ACE5GG_04960 [Candidatus Omnitrophota bacterium]